MNAMLAITGMNMILFGLEYMIESKLAKSLPPKSFIQRRWRTLTLGVCLVFNLFSLCLLKVAGA